MSTDTDQPTETFAEKHRRLWTEQAEAEQAVLDQQRCDVRKLLRVGRGEQLGEILELDPELLVAEVKIAGFGTVWRVVVDGKVDFNAWSDRWTAITSAVGLRHNAGPDAGVYAARVLNIPQNPEA